MASTEYELVARVGKARGLEGEVTATAAGDLPFSVYAGLRVHVVPPTMYGRRELTVSSVEDGSGNTYRLMFEEIDSIDDAEQLAGRFLLAAEDDLDIVETSAHDIGRSIVDERYGELGTITEVIETPANDVWVVQGPRGEVLVPIIDDVIVEYPEDSQASIRTALMDGLLES